MENTPSLQERVVGAPILFVHPVGDLGIALAPGSQVEDDTTDLFDFRTTYRLAVRDNGQRFQRRR